MLFHQARQGKKCLYLTTLSEPSLKLIAYMQQFSFFEESMVAQNRIVFADLGAVVRRKVAEDTLTEITTRVEREEPAVVVIDSFKALQDLLGDPAATRPGGWKRWSASSLPASACISTNRSSSARWSARSRSWPAAAIRRCQRHRTSPEVIQIEWCTHPI
jgi:hypothetical protein